MARRYHRQRNRNSTGATIKAVVEACNHSRWLVAATAGLFLFVLFYVFLPFLMGNYFENNLTQTPLRGMLRQLFEYRLHWLEYMGIVFGLIGVFFAVKNFFFSQRLSANGEAGVGFLSRVFGRLVNNPTLKGEACGESQKPS
ncbi:hypothetical protein [Thiomicrorhabdus aquaedulcis]|uniref:hypothetical protein n=1 Tax=Thiomicrorhabdus aquaedulcis TaxID=2211106 RepID=UPI000FDBA8CA|nr:hypothetical protein [Thiomicrorhabdus aquaedulcis]